MAGVVPLVRLGWLVGGLAKRVACLCPPHGPPEVAQPIASCLAEQVPRLPWLVAGGLVGPYPEHVDPVLGIERQTSAHEVGFGCAAHRLSGGGMGL